MLLRSHAEGHQTAASLIGPDGAQLLTLSSPPVNNVDVVPMVTAKREFNGAVL